MQDFQHGPFEFTPSGRPINFNGQDTQRWEMLYGRKSLGIQALGADAARPQIIEAFSIARAHFVRDCMPATAAAAPRTPGVVRLVRSTSMTGVAGEVLGRFEQNAEIPGIAAGLIDDRFPTWLVNAAKQCVPMGMDKFERLRAAHAAVAGAEKALAVASSPRIPQRAWIAALLPDDVLTHDPSAWRAPTSWEMRHVVGEGSFTGITGAAAAALVGVTPQNFRKYTAREGASTQQAMGYAMWHLLLQRLGVQSAPGA